MADSLGGWSRYNLATVVNNPLPTFDLRTLDLAGFRRWLNLHLARWASDPAFVQRARVRDLRRAHPDLRPLEEDHRRAPAPPPPPGPRPRSPEGGGRPERA